MQDFAQGAERRDDQGHWACQVIELVTMYEVP